MPPSEFKRPIGEILTAPDVHDVLCGLETFVEAIRKQRLKLEEEQREKARKLVQEEEQRRQEEARRVMEIEREEKRRAQKERLIQRKAQAAEEAKAAAAAAFAEKQRIRKAILEATKPTNSIGPRKAAPPKFWGTGVQRRKGAYFAHSNNNSNRDRAYENFLVKQPTNVLPMERVKINPFGAYDNEADGPADKPDPLRKQFFAPSQVSWLADELDTVLTKQELSYIREEGDEEAPTFSTRMKYWML